MSRFFSGLRFRLLVLVILACAPFVALTLHTAWEDRRRAKAGWRARTQRLTQLATREEEKLIGGTRQLLIAIAESDQVRKGNQRASQSLMDQLFASYPRYANLGLVKTNGLVVASALPVSEPTNQSARAYFKRTLETRAFSVGDFPAGPTGSGRPAVNFGYPVFDKNGQVQAVVFASLDLDWLSRFGSELPAQLPAKSVWTEVDTNGVILVRYPAAENQIGLRAPDDPVIKTAFIRSKGVIEGMDPKGVPTYYGFSTMKSQLAPGRVVAILGIPRQVLFAEADRILGRNLSWLGIAVSLGLAIGWVGSKLLILRPVKALADSSARLAAGDLSARTGLPYGRDELGQLTRAFDQMAQVLEHREVERQRANNKLQALSRRLVEVQESERRHIARELHDEVGQALTAAELNLQAAMQSPGAAALAPRLQASTEMIQRVLEQVHDLSLKLRPSLLDDLGLEPAVRWYTNRQAELTGLKAEFRADPLEDRLDSVIETECFRVAQEALTNVVRHSQARSVSVQLTRNNGHLNLSVRDDGVGFNVAAMREQAVRGSSLGLLSMEERAVLAGGGLEFISAPGEGTEVRAWFPLKWRNGDVINE